MIYTVTFNPSLDYIIKLPKLNLSEVNRAQSAEYVIGGKGINVSAVLCELGAETTALGFAGGFVGDEIIQRLKNCAFPACFIKTAGGASRINVKLKANEETEINAAGPYICQGELQRLYEKLTDIGKGDVLVLAGSAARGINYDEYAKLVMAANMRGALTVVDTTGEMLLNAVKNKPFLIKPNIYELEEIMGEKLCGNEDVLEAAQKLQKLGAQNVLVSLGGDGAMLLCADGTAIRCTAPNGDVINTTGAGDSMVAGFLSEYIISGDYGNSLYMAVAAGSATAFSDKLACGEEIRMLYKRIVSDNI